MKVKTRTSKHGVNPLKESKTSKNALMREKKYPHLYLYIPDFGPFPVKLFFTKKLDVGMWLYWKELETKKKCVRNRKNTEQCWMIDE